MKKLTTLMLVLFSLGLSAQSVIEITYLDIHPTKIDRFVELHKTIVDMSQGEERTVDGHWVYRHWYGSGGTIAIYDIFDSAEDVIKDDAFAVFSKNFDMLSEERQKEVSKIFQEWWSFYDGHTDEMRVIDFEKDFSSKPDVNWDQPYVFVVGKYNSKNIQEMSQAYLDWQIFPGVNNGLVMGGGTSSHFKGSGHDVEVFQSYENIVAFANSISGQSSDNADARSKFWDNVTGAHEDQIYIHVGHLVDGVFDLAGN